MNSAFGEIFLFLTNLAWKSRMTIPVLVTTVFLIMDIRLQIEINIQSGQVAAADLDELEDSDSDNEGYGDDELSLNNDDDEENIFDAAGNVAAGSVQNDSDVIFNLDL